VNTAVDVRSRFESSPAIAEGYARHRFVMHRVRRPSDAVV
jgi:hypothetical protein